jgi:hypothetical protein
MHNTSNHRNKYKHSASYFMSNRLNNIPMDTKEYYNELCKIHSLIDGYDEKKLNMSDQHYSEQQERQTTNMSH